jgi:multiple sugar transport system substrate-binding protein
MKIHKCYLPIFFLAILLSGCGKREAAEEEGKTVISFTAPAPPEHRAVYQQVMRIFMRKHPHIKVKFYPTTGQRYEERVQTEMLAGEAPDVLWWQDEYFPGMAQAGQFLDITPFIEAENYDLSDFFELSIKEFSFKGRQYGLPQAWGASIIFYNKDLFEKYGVEYNDDTWDWDAFIDACKRLTRDIDGDGKVDMFGIQAINTSFYAFIPIWAAGAEVLNEDKTRCIINTPEARTAFRWWAERWTKHKIQIESFAEAGGGVVSLPDQAFAEGKVAMYETGAFFAHSLRSFTKFRWGIAYMPICPFTGKRSTRYYGDGYAIWSKSKHPKEAWELLKFLAGPVGQRMMAQLGRSVPARKSIAYSKYFNREDTSWEEWRLVDAINHAHLQPITPQYNEFDNIAQQITERVTITQDLTPEEGLALMEKEINKLLARGS